MSEGDFEELARLSRREHDELFRSGSPLSIEEIAGYDFCGWNCSVVPRLGGFQKFLKGFRRRPGDPPGRGEGFNVPVIQNGIDGDWLGLPADDDPRRFGWYSVSAVGDSIARAHPQALLLDYGAHPANRRFDPTRLLRDVVVKLDRDANLLLGRAHLDFGRWLFVGYFLLRRRAPLRDRG
jgi:hypothetical protein